MSPEFEELCEYSLKTLKNDKSWEAFQGRNVDKSAWFNMVTLTPTQEHMVYYDDQSSSP